MHTQSGIFAARVALALLLWSVWLAIGMTSGYGTTYRDNIFEEVAAHPSIQTVVLAAIVAVGWSIVAWIALVFALFSMWRSKKERGVLAAVGAALVIAYISVLMFGRPTYNQHLKAEYEKTVKSMTSKALSSFEEQQRKDEAKRIKDAIDQATKK